MIKITYIWKSQIFSFMVTILIFEFNGTQNTVLGGKVVIFASKQDFFAQEGEKLRKSILFDLSEKNLPLVSVFLK